ncbi:MAG: DsrE family protein [Thermodesulfovibrionales bacterium]|nr:DsrE family protein [Thermodesulfovibrionales bacterium]
MGKLTVGSFASPIGSLTTDFAVKLCEAALKKGHSVDLWLSGNATTLSKKGQKSFRDYSAFEKTIEELLKTGRFQMTTCEACSEARGIHKNETIDGVQVKTMDWYLASCFTADRVLLIGGD